MFHLSKTIITPSSKTIFGEYLSKKTIVNLLLNIVPQISFVQLGVLTSEFNLRSRYRR